MKLLLLNTCGAEGSLALADTDLVEPIVLVKTMPGRTASELLVAVLREAMGEAGWKLGKLTAIAVVTGPGSFTGVRVGLSVAKGLSEASGVPTVAVSRLAMMAAMGARSRAVCALLDAGRGEFYCGQYLDGREMGETLLPLDNAMAAASKTDVAVVCEEAVVKAFSGMVTLRRIDEPTAEDALSLAVKRIESGWFDNPMTLDANYLRRTDAEIFAKPVARRS